MRKLKNGILVMMAAVLLVTAMLVTNCNNPNEGLNPVNEGDDFIPFDPPEGMGYIRIRVTDNSARSTILPTLPTVASMYYSVVVTDDLDSNAVKQEIGKTTPVNKTTLDSTAISLMPGTYSVEVFAYKTASTTTIVGHKKNTAIPVSTGTGGSTTVSLEPYTTYDSVPGDRQGTLTWSITGPSNANGTTSTTLTVTTYPSGSAVASVTGLSGTTVALDVGFYYARIASVDTSGALQNRTITNIIHIYQNMDTNFTLAVPTLNPFKHTVTYDPNGGDTISPDTFGSIAHGSTLTEYTDSPPATQLTHSTPGYEFDSWHREIPTTATSKWVFGTTKLLGDITLYATWKQEEDLTLTINWATLTNPTLSTSSYTFYQSNYYNGINQTVTVTVSGLDHWEYGGASIGSTLTLSNSSNTDYFSEGDHIFTAVGTDDSKPYSVDFTLTVGKVAP